MSRGRAGARSVPGRSSCPWRPAARPPGPGRRGRPRPGVVAGQLFSPRWCAGPGDPPGRQGRPTLHPERSERRWSCRQGNRRRQPAAWPAPAPRFQRHRSHSGLVSPVRRMPGRCAAKEDFPGQTTKLADVSGEASGRVSGEAFGVSRDADRLQMPEPMRRDVRLLGDLLGQVLRESGGQDLLDDVERLRRAVIAARQAGPRDGPPDDGAADPAGDEIAALVAGWPLDRAELVARAFTVYFHLTNLAEEQQRVRTLRERDSGAAPARESLAAAVAEFRQEQGTDQLDDLLTRLRVHPVLTAHT